MSWIDAAIAAVMTATSSRSSTSSSSSAAGAATGAAAGAGACVLCFHLVFEDADELEAADQDADEDQYQEYGTHTK